MTSEKYKKKKYFGILIAVRSDSNRLPKKHFKIINNKLGLSVLDYCIMRCKKSKIQNIILCTSNHKNDDIFVKCAKKNNIEIFQGSKNNVLKRYIDCAEKYNISDIVRITGDCPLVDKKIINNLLNVYQKNDYDYVGNVTPSTFPDGLDVEIMKLSTLKKSYSENKSRSNKEHVTLHIRKSSKYKKYNMAFNKTNLSKIRWTVDTENDLKLIKKIVMEFHPKIHFDWKKIYKLRKFN
ncbi:glycosyltransferase family protein [Candidatus Pelagibacter sp.]|nr:glycosyltransferase family protein [Candidatus Pelagibacter sp.]